MDSLRFNKIAAGVLCAGLLIMALDKVSDMLVNPKIIAENTYPIKVEENEDNTEKVTTASVIEPIISLLSNADTSSGKKIAKKCTACHAFEAGGANKVGPNLYNIVNKSIAKSDFAYSKAFLALNGQWTYEELNKFLYKPKKYVKGTKMNFVGLKKTEDRANLIAWLRTLSNEPVSLPNK